MKYLLEYLFIYNRYVSHYSPCLSCSSLYLVHPGLVDVYGVSVNAQGLVLNDIFHHGGEKLPEGVLAPSTSVKAHYHFNDCRIPSDNVLDLVYFWPGSVITTVLHSFKSKFVMLAHCYFTIILS